MLTDSEIRGEFQENYRYSHDYWAPFVKDAQVYTLAAAGYTWSDQERQELIKEGREPMELNIIRQPLNFFSGYLRDNINEIVYDTVEGSNPKTAEQMTKLSYNIWDEGKGFTTFLDAADEGLKSGISLCGIQMDYRRDFINGDIGFFKRTYNSFFLDPTFECLDLRDASFAITRDLISKQSAKSLLPFIDPMAIDDISQGYRDDKFMTYHPEFTTFSRNRNLLAYDQYYKRINKEREYLCDMRSSYSKDITDLSSEEKKKLKIGIARFHKMRMEADELGIDEKDIPIVEIRKVQRDFVELNIMLNGQRMYCGEDKTGIVHTYPFAPLICYFEPSIWKPSLRIQGISASNWSAQRQFIKRHMKIIDMMDSDIATGFKYLLGAVPDVGDMQQSGQNKLIGVEGDPEINPIGLDAVQQLQGGGCNPALIEYQSVLDNLTLKLSNINESVLGVDEGGNTQISGRLAQMRLAQGLRGNRKIFDNIADSQEILGGLILKVIQNKMPPGKVQRIINEEPTEEFYSQEWEEYRAVVKEGIRSKTQKDAYYYELVNLKRDGIVNVPEAEIVRALAMSGLSDLQEAIERQSEQQAEVMAIEQQKQKAELAKLESEEQANLGLAQERRSRVLSNIGLEDERESEAQRNMAQATLDRARAISEISQLNENRILQVLQFLNQIELQESTGRELQKSQAEQRADQLNSETEGTMENQQMVQNQQEMSQVEQAGNDVQEGL